MRLSNFISEGMLIFSCSLFGFIAIADMRPQQQGKGIGHGLKAELS